MPAPDELQCVLDDVESFRVSLTGNVHGKSLQAMDNPLLVMGRPPPGPSCPSQFAHPVLNDWSERAHHLAGFRGKYGVAAA
jgi:hypothetical protein